MASHTVQRSKHSTLVADTVDTVALTGKWAAVEVKNRAAAGEGDIYFTADGSTPTVGGDDTDIVCPGESLVVPLSSALGGDKAAKLKSAGASPYSVRGVPA